MYKNISPHELVCVGCKADQKRLDMTPEEASAHWSFDPGQEPGSDAERIIRRSIKTNGWKRDAPPVLAKPGTWKGTEYLFVLDGNTRTLAARAEDVDAVHVQVNNSPTLDAVLTATNANSARRKRSGWEQVRKCRQLLALGASDEQVLAALCVKKAQFRITKRIAQADVSDDLAEFLRRGSVYTYQEGEGDDKVERSVAVGAPTMTEVRNAKVMVDGAEVFLWDAPADAQLRWVRSRIRAIGRSIVAKGKKATPRDTGARAKKEFLAAFTLSGEYGQDPAPTEHVQAVQTARSIIGNKLGGSDGFAAGLWFAMNTSKAIAGELADSPLEGLEPETVKALVQVWTAAQDQRKERNGK